MAILKVDTITSADTPTVSITDGASISGVTTFSSDINIADKIVHTGDTNTAIRFPSVDTITVETGGSERLRIDSGGRVIAGYTATAGKDSTLQAVGNGGDLLDVSRYVANANGPNLHFCKARNDTVGSHTIVQSNDTLGIINFRGSDGDSFDVAAEISSEVDGTPGSGDMPGRLTFSTTADGANSATGRMRIASDGQVRIGSEYSSNRASHICQISQAANTSAVLSLHNPTNSAGQGIKLGFYARNSNNAAVEYGRIQTIAETTTANSSQKGYMSFFVNQSASMSEKLRIKGDGNLWLPLDNQQIKLGAGLDFSLYHDGTLNHITSNGNAALKVSTNGVQFFEYSGVTKAATIDQDGLKFNADTAAANALDDYEEGTFTLIISDTGGNNPTSGGTMNYTKIGRWVNCWGQVTMGNAASAVGSAHAALKGWPFNTGSFNSNDIPVWVWNNGTDVYEDGFLSVSTATGNNVWGLYIHKYNTATNVSGNDMGSAPVVSLGFSYEV